MNFYPDAYVAYLVEFHRTRDYFECHELLEEYWKDHPADGKSLLWVGLIQLAVGQYHHRRGNVKGACKMFRKALLRLYAVNLAEAGIDGDTLLSGVNDIAGALERGEPLPYRSWKMPINDPELENRCRSASLRLGLSWDTGGAIPVDEVVHRHKLRDRSEVVEARRKSLEAKHALRRKC